MTREYEGHPIAESMIAAVGKSQDGGGTSISNAISRRALGHICSDAQSVCRHLDDLIAAILDEEDSRDATRHFDYVINQLSRARTAFHFPEGK